MSSSGKVRVGIIGAGGFTGRELVGFLSKHTGVSLVFVTSSRYVNQKVSDVFPELGVQCTQLVFKDHPKNISDFVNLDIVFIAAPDEVSLQWVEVLLQNNIRVIDIGGSFRFENAHEFEKSYNLTHSAPHLLAQATYGLSEIFRSKISSSKLIGNPGCYPTAALLPLWFLKDTLKESIDLIIIDAKSGVSGAGARKEKDSIQFSQIAENFYAYKIDQHQHKPEIQSQVHKWLGDNIRIRFIPHLLPLFRGILCTMYISVLRKVNSEELRKEIKHKVAGEPFIRFFDHPNMIELKKVQRTNFIDFSISYDEDSQVLSVISAIDNLVKGAAGQAIQNMNLMCGFDEVSSLL